MGVRKGCLGGGESGSVRVPIHDVELSSDDGRTMFFRRPHAPWAWGESVVRKYWARSVWGVMVGRLRERYVGGCGGIVLG